MKLRVFEAFAGYGSQMLALKRLAAKYPDFEPTCVGFSEIEPSAVVAHTALHPGAKNYGDITKIDWGEVSDFDLFTYSSPCQDFSSAGRMRGGEKGSNTRSSLLWECERAIEAKRPKYLLFENVPMLVSSKFIDTFTAWLDVLGDLGYKNYYKVLNAADYGVPQHRLRVFAVSIRKDVHLEFYFPKKMKLKESMIDRLDDEVPGSYYMPKKAVDEYIQFLPADFLAKYNAKARNDE